MPTLRTFLLITMMTPSLFPQTPGSFAGEYQGAQMRLKLQQAGGEYRGVIEFQGAQMPVVARPVGDRLQGTFQFQSGSFPCTIERDADGLVLTTDGTTYRLAVVGGRPANPLAKQRRDPEPAAPSAHSLTGNWRGQQGAIRFDPDGTGVSNGEPFKYRVEGSTLILIDPRATLRVTFAVEGDKLRLSGSTGEMTMTREAGAEAAPTAGARAGDGQVRPELAGKWCYVSNINATGGGARNSNICFTLSPDGRYEYYGETDSYGPAGGATSQGSDRGSWTATETTLTARSVSGKVVTYQFEKRNHPRNNDPMLVINGQPFVTFYQKAPWR